MGLLIDHGGDELPVEAMPFGLFLDNVLEVGQPRFQSLMILDQVHVVEDMYVRVVAVADLAQIAAFLDPVQEVVELPQQGLVPLSHGPAQGLLLLDGEGDANAGIEAAVEHGDIGVRHGDPDLSPGHPADELLRGQVGVQLDVDL